jgi:hypothetical protein
MLKVRRGYLIAILRNVVVRYLRGEIPFTCIVCQQPVVPVPPSALRLAVKDRKVLRSNFFEMLSCSKFFMIAVFKIFLAHVLLQLFG